MPEKTSRKRKPLQIGTTKSVVYSRKKSALYSPTEQAGNAHILELDWKAFIFCQNIGESLAMRRKFTATIACYMVGPIENRREDGLDVSLSVIHSYRKFVPGQRNQTVVTGFDAFRPTCFFCSASMMNEL